MKEYALRYGRKICMRPDVGDSKGGSTSGNLVTRHRHGRVISLHGTELPESDSAVNQLLGKGTWLHTKFVEEHFGEIRRILKTYLVGSFGDTDGAGF